MSKLAVVFAGGGGKGAYQIGVWKALKEYGVDSNIGAIAGTSVGALNALAFLQGDYELAEKIWRNISHSKILKNDALKWLKPIIGFAGAHISSVVIKSLLEDRRLNGFFSNEGLKQIIDQHIDLNAVSSSPIQCYITCCHVPSFSATYFKINGEANERIKSMVLASTALPFIFDSIKIDNQQYIDGGFADNVPVMPLYEEGYRIFLVVHLSRDSLIDAKNFPNAKIIQIVPRSHQGELIDGTLDFNSANAMVRIQQGYEDTKKILQPLYEMGLVQTKITETLQQMQEDEMAFNQRRQEILQERKLLKNELERMLNNE